MNSYSTEEKQQAIDLYFKNICNIRTDVLQYEIYYNGIAVY